MILFKDLDKEVFNIAKKGAGPFYVFSPYIKNEPIAKILENLRNRTFFVVTCVRINDLVVGASDIEVYRTLLAHGVLVFVNNSIHLKVYSEDCRRGLIGSANCTNRGLGFGIPGNQEVLAYFDQFDADFSNYLEKIIENSTLLSGESVNQIEKKYEEVKSLRLPIEDFSELNSEFEGELRRSGSIFSSQMPFTNNPNEVLRSLVDQSLDRSSQVSHDIDLFRLNGFNGDLSQFMIHAWRGFRQTVFFLRLEEVIEDSINFGGIRRFFEKMCVEDPRPSRARVNELINNFFFWIEYLENEEYEVIQPNHTKILVRK